MEIAHFLKAMKQQFKGLLLTATKLVLADYVAYSPFTFNCAQALAAK